MSELLEAAVEVAAKKKKYYQRQERYLDDAAKMLTGDYEHCWDDPQLYQEELEECRETLARGVIEWDDAEETDRERVCKEVRQIVEWVFPVIAGGVLEEVAEGVKTLTHTDENFYASDQWLRVTAAFYRERNSK